MEEAELETAWTELKRWADFLVPGQRSIEGVKAGGAEQCGSPGTPLEAGHSS